MMRYLLILVVLLTAACGPLQPSESKIQTALAQTRSAETTPTSHPQPTAMSPEATLAAIATTGPVSTIPPVTATAGPVLTPTAVPTPGPQPDSPPEGETQGCGNAVGNGNEIVSGPSGPEGEDRDSVFRSLTVHPTDPNTILMGTERNGFVKSTDGGVTWTRYRQGLRHMPGGGYPEIWDIAISPSDPPIILAATLDSPGPVTGDFPSSIAGIYKSTDGGETWTRKNCGLTSSRITSIRFDPTNPDIAIAGVEGGEATFTCSGGLPCFPDESNYFDGGIYRTTDEGENWTRISLGPNDDKNGFWRIVARGSGPSIFITFGMNYYDLSENLGFLVSMDGGASWESLESDQLTPLMITSFDASSDGNVIYANARDSYHHWISTDGGSTWTKSPSNQANGPVAVSPADPNVVIFSAMSTLYRSTDGLQTHNHALTPTTPPGHQGPPPFQDIVFAPSDPNVVYAATEGYLLYKSTDGGASFTLIKDIRSDVLNANHSQEEPTITAIPDNTLEPTFTPTPIPTPKPTLTPTFPSPVEGPSSTATAAAPATVPPPAKPARPTATPAPEPEPSGGGGMCGGVAALPLALLGIVYLRHRRR